MMTKEDLINAIYDLQSYCEKNGITATIDDVVAMMEEVRKHKDLDKWIKDNI